MKRRDFLAASVLGLAGAANAAAQAGKKTIAGVCFQYTHNGHPDVIFGRMLGGYSPNGVRMEPQTRLVSLYTAQVKDDDLSRGVVEKYKLRNCSSIAEALTLGGNKLAVDGVCFVGEHGDYPDNDMGQHLYPRYEFFSQIVDVFRQSGRSVPVYSDKHFSYEWRKAKQMYDWSHELKFPLMAGSSLPVTVRTPELELPLGCALEHAVSVGYGPSDAYGFHGLETLQCMVERRKGAETGVAAVNGWKGTRCGSGGIARQAGGAPRCSLRPSPSAPTANRAVPRITARTRWCLLSITATASGLRITC